ncbi:RagB/SusD family nutrient uptake outer membrane protein [Salinimicrobium terrae]|uniref:RagB/SusD family nutrient uptake outer membrane protein n=1 Tax=Salinimicrobium terrae TaxID=470866 RepID=UPI0004276EBF|nr:RagB/SusD family nutrient uptake outer membrane protein [Salinimicrobium terrae]
MTNLRITLLAVFTVMFYSCSDFETDLEVENLEQPSSAQIGIQSTADVLFQNWYQTANHVNGPAIAFATMADAFSMSWGNFAARDVSSEPRTAWNNSATYGNAAVTETYFNSMHAILADANAIMIGIEGEGVFDNEDKYESLARFGQGASLGYLALVFDRVFASDETGTLNEGEPLGYEEATLLALEKLDLAIAAADRGTFDMDMQVNGMNLNNEEWSQFLNSFAARIYVNSARNVEERQNLDWQRVLDYAQNGQNYDLLVLSDGGQTWYNYWAYVVTWFGWPMVDLRVINLMDEDYPDYWPEGVTTLPPAESEDARLEMDFEYVSAPWFRPERGTYHFSTYRYSRYDEYDSSGLTTAIPELLEAENNLYLAEAYLYLGMLQEAADVINSGTRVVRGDLPPVAVDADAIADAIFYERHIELLSGPMGLRYFEMRAHNLLQEGTPKHFPIPGAALNAAGIPIYTFGAGQGEAGVDYSDGGWR